MQGATAIERELVMSIKTVETHQRRIREKLKLPTAAALRVATERWMGKKPGPNPRLADYCTGTAADW